MPITRRYKIVSYQSRKIVMGELVNGRSRYSDADRRRAVVEYCISGLMTKVSESTGIPGEAVEVTDYQVQFGTKKNKRINPCPK